MAGFCPTEGLEEVAKEVVDNTSRTTDLELGLFTTAVPNAATTYASLGKPTSAGTYLVKTLGDGTWTPGADGVRTYGVQTFTAGTGGWTGDIYGYYIATATGATTRKILAIEIDPDVGVPYTMGENDTYAVTPTINFTPAP
jgi:hypothetical protein